MAKLNRTRQGHITMAREGSLSLTWIGSGYTTEEWAEMLGFSEATQTAAPQVALVFVAEGVDISAEHRRMAADSSGQQPPVALALLTASRLARGAMTAFSWLLPGKTKYRAFNPTDKAEALAWLVTFQSFDMAAAGALVSAVEAQGPGAATA